MSAQLRIPGLSNRKGNKEGEEEGAKGFNSDTMEKFPVTRNVAAWVGCGDCETR
jgi:hypothetical protein